MSDLRLDFYNAINKANNYKPKPIKEKKVVKDSISIDEQIKNLLSVSESAVIVEEVSVENDRVVELLYNLYKKDEETIRKEKEAEKLFKEIEEQREIARKEYRIRTSLQEKISSRAGASPTPSSSSNSSAGSGGGTRSVVSKYYEPGYIDPGYIE